MPAGVESQADRLVAVGLIGGGALVFVLVILLTAWALRSARSSSGPSGRRPIEAGGLQGACWLAAGGLVLPAILLVVLHGTNLRELSARLLPPPADALVVSVHGRLWWWELRLWPDGEGDSIVLANELHLPVGRAVRLALGSEDVIHSLWMPALGGKLDLVPGRVQHLVVRPTKTGRWAAPCAEFCGSAHTSMVLQTAGPSA